MVKRLDKSQEDDALLTVYWSGDNDVPGFWVAERHKETLYTVSRDYLSVEKDIEDTLQDTALKLMKTPVARRQRTFNAGRKASVKTCLSTMVKNKCVDLYRKQSTRRRHEGAQGTLWEKEVVDLQQRLEAADLADALRQQVAAKHGEAWSHLLAMLIEGHNYEDMAEALGLTVNTLYQRVRVLRCRVEMLLLNEPKHAN